MLRKIQPWDLVCDRCAVSITIFGKIGDDINTRIAWKRLFPPGWLVVYATESNQPKQSKHLIDLCPDCALAWSENQFDQSEFFYELKAKGRFS